MDKEIAKEFLYHRHFDDTIYISKSLDKILEVSDSKLISVYGVVDTDSGEKLFYMDYSYSGELILTNVFLHKESYMKANAYKPKVYL